MKSTILYLLLTLPAIRGSPFQYSIFQENAYSGSESRHRNKNWCAHVAQKNVSFVVAGGTESFVQPEVLPCPPEVPNCAQQVIYRTLFRQMYKIGYKIVSQLEWRCCPGYQGYDCKEIKDTRLLSTSHSHSSPSGQIPVPQGPRMHTERPWAVDGQFPVHLGHKPPFGGADSATRQQLEEKVEHLSQMVLDMQAKMTDMASSLRVDFQEDASKMLVSLLNDFKPPSNARSANIQTIQLQDFSIEPGTQHMDEVMNIINQVTGDLESNTNTLNDVLDRVSQHDGQIRLLMETAEKPITTPAPGHKPDLQPYLDEKIRALKEELMEGIEIKMADLKNSCEYKMMSVCPCESQESQYFSLAELMESKEADLRSEIEQLKSKLERDGQQQARSSSLPDSVEARVENIERCLNLSEKSLSGQCVSFVGHLSAEQSLALQDLKKTMEAKLVSLQDKLGSLLVNTKTNSSPVFHLTHDMALDKAGNFTGNTIHNLQNRLNKTEAKITAMEKIHQDCQKDIDTLKTTIFLQHEKLGAMEKSISNNKLSIENLTEELSSVKNDHETTDCTEKVGKELNSRIVVVEGLCSKLEPISNGLQRIKDGLNRHVTSLWSCVNQLNGTVGSQSRDINQLRGTCQNLQTYLSAVTKDLQSFSTSPPKDTADDVTGPPQAGSTDEPSLPKITSMATGEASSPGKMNSSQLPKGAEGRMAPVQGYAGAPVEKITFSVGLTLNPFLGDTGIIKFNKVLVNDGGNYDPHTGIFTAPIDGRYLVSAVLAPQRGEKVEAVLSVLNHSIQKLDSSGFLSGAIEPHGLCNCSSVASLSLVLPLKQGDRVGLILTAGKLAISASSEILSTFSAVLLHATPVQR